MNLLIGYKPFLKTLLVIKESSQNMGPCVFELCIKSIIKNLHNREFQYMTQNILKLLAVSYLNI